MRRGEDGVVRSARWRGPPRARGTSTTSMSCALQESLPDWPGIWEACVRRTRAWRVPPRWSPRDWWEEIDAEGLAAACDAVRVFDPSRGPSLGSFVYHQILAAALARYRQEWNYALRYQPSAADPALESRSDEDVATDLEERRLRRSMTRLPEADRRLIERLFWEGWTEVEVASCLGISRQAVNKRKRKILLTLRRSLKKADGP
jgi:RNA polymerase sigma factor (sigma-70 family)